MEMDFYSSNENSFNYDFKEVAFKKEDFDRKGTIDYNISEQPFFIEDMHGISVFALAKSIARTPEVWILSLPPISVWTLFPKGATIQMLQIISGCSGSNFMMTIEVQEASTPSDGHSKVDECFNSIDTFSEGTDGNFIAYLCIL
jgi:hypothetical protein